MAPVADRHRPLHGAARGCAGIAPCQRPTGYRPRPAPNIPPSEWPATNLTSRLRSRPASVSSDPKRRERHRHQRRLGILGRASASPTAPPRITCDELLAERLVDFGENRARGGANALGQRLAHADGLAALARKNQRNRHDTAPGEFRPSRHWDLGGVKLPWFANGRSENRVC